MPIGPDDQVQGEARLCIAHSLRRHIEQFGGKRRTRLANNKHRASKQTTFANPHSLSLSISSEKVSKTKKTKNRQARQVESWRLLFIQPLAHSISCRALKSSTPR